jgi:hypothetical protein
MYILYMRFSQDTKKKLNVSVFVGMIPLNQPGEPQRYRAGQALRSLKSPDTGSATGNMVEQAIPDRACNTLFLI